MKDDDIKIEKDSEEQVDDIVPEGEELQDLVKKFRAQLKVSQKERDEYLTGWQRAKADYINLTREHEKSRKDFGAYADEAFFEDLLPVLESFGMAFSNKEAWEKAPKEWRVGVEYIHSQLLEALKQHHIEEYAPKAGEKLDPRFHAPVATIPVTDEALDHTIVEVVKNGYKRADKVLRPADVKIGEFKERVEGTGDRV